MIAVLAAVGGAVAGRCWGRVEGKHAGRREAERDAMEDASARLARGRAAVRDGRSAGSPHERLRSNDEHW